MLPGKLEQGGPGRHVEGERLLRVDVLARGEGGTRDLRVRQRHRQVEHHVDVRVRPGAPPA